MTLLRIFKRLTNSKDKAFHISLFCPGSFGKKWSLFINSEDKTIFCEKHKSRKSALDGLKKWSNSFDPTNFKYYTFYDMENMFHADGMQVIKFNHAKIN